LPAKAIDSGAALLTILDESPWHQIPATFDHAGTSDPRFFDRFWFAASDPTTTRALQFTLGVYQNMNVVDGGFIAIDNGTQYNVRTSRQLRPRYETDCGPLRIDVIKPMQHLHLTIQPHGGQVHGEVDWIADLPAQEERHHFNRVNGRVVEDYLRYDQTGTVNGWLDIEGQRHNIDSWWACRDHSWGVRSRVGIAEPVTGPALTPSGFAFAFLFFSTDTHGGHVQFSQLDYSADVTSQILEKSTGESLSAEMLATDATFVDDQRPRRFDQVRFNLTTTCGQDMTIDAAATGPAVAMQGLGYGGYDDGLGLGVYRGNNHLEIDTYDVTHPTDIVLPNETTARPLHRIQPVRITLYSPEGTSRGTGSLTFIAELDLDPDGHLRLTNNPHAHPRHRLAAKA
jgi:hypothetical protein